MGRLTKMSHPGGIYTGQTVETVVKDICGAVPVTVKSIIAGTQLYGWLPYCKPSGSSARDNLSQVLFAVGAALGTDQNGVLRVEPLWDGISGVVTMDRIYQGASVAYSTPVSAVTVAAHQYTTGGEEKTLFDGSTDDGDIITFDEPMYDLSATGFTILESGANYAKLSAGTGVLVGHAYVHSTFSFTVTVNSGAAENVKNVTDATLVSAYNAASAAQRLADYYKCTETISASILAQGERPGQLVSIYHPYEEKMVTACIATMDGTMSAKLKAETTALVDFTPPQIGEAKYYDYSEIITEDTEWEVPEGVVSVTAVLIGGGYGGSSGCQGSSVPSPPSISDAGYQGYDASDGGAGGAGGTVGQGGKVSQGIVSVTGGQKISAHIGKGGAGGVHSSSGSNAGSEGGATTFGDLTSANGASSASGFVDPISGQVYATPGTLSGIAGGKGSGYNTTTRYTKGPNVTDYSGNTWSAGNITSSSENAVLEQKYNGTTYYAEQGRGCGGGAAVGRNGNNAPSATTPTSLATVYTGTTGKGADAVKPAKSATRGGGGNGGHGGGGEGGSGMAASNFTTVYAYIGTKNGPGAGSDGGDGGDGIIILYYRAQKAIGAGDAGAVMESTGRFLLDRTGRLMIV
jgi:hypothetical protein